MTLFNILSTPSPVLALTSITSSSTTSKKSIRSFLTAGISAEGKSILLMIGIIFKPKSLARFVCAMLWASIPWVASTINSALSHADSYRDTS